jgi:hypothetical protein
MTETEELVEKVVEKKYWKGQQKQRKKLDAKD